MKEFIIISALVCCSTWLLAQADDPYLDYLTDFHRQEAQYSAQLRSNHPDLSREDLKELIREYYKDNFRPPKPASRNEPANKQMLQTQNNVNFNQVPDDIEYLALRELFMSTNGHNWTSHNNWDYPNWKNPSTVTYADFEDWEGVIVENGDIVSISLRGYNLTGSLPSQLGNLTSLKYLMLGDSWGGNQITGPIPPEFGNLVSLRSLYLSNNLISGHLPKELGQLSNLTDLFLENNRISGSIPPEWGNMSSLYDLRLDNNLISGKIPEEFNNLSQLSLFSASNNYIAELPESMSGLTSLYDLELSLNQLSGSLPAQLAELPFLTWLELGHNDFYGPIPHEWDNITFSYVYINNNRVYGSLEFLENLDKHLIRGLMFDNNLFDFENLEYLFTDSGPKFWLYDFRYSPQYTTLGTPQTLTFNQNRPLNIPFSTGGEHNLYQWQKREGTTWLDIPGADSAYYFKPNAALADAGTYRCKVTNEWVTGLTLYSHEAVVNVIEVASVPTADSVHLCPGETAILAASGEGTIYWFSAESGGDTLAIGSSYTTPVLSESTTYYISQQVGDLHSERVPVVALVGPVFTAPEDQSICMGSDVTLAIMGENFSIDWGNLGNDLAIVVSPDTTTTYVYTVEDEFGCAVTDSITVTVLDSLIAEIIPPAAVCPGDLVTFEAVEVPGATYTWEPGELSGRTITVQADEMQEYTVTLTNSNGCTATASEFVPFAALATVSEDQTICVTDSVVLDVEGGDSYLWSTGDTTAQITFHPEAAGEYTFTVNVTTDSCTSTQDVVVTVEPYCPGVPVSFYARAISTSEIALQWQEPEGNHEQYVIQKRNAEGLYETVATVPIGNASWDDTALEPDSLYYYRIFSQVVSAQSTDRFGRARTFKPNENYVRETIVLVEGVEDASLVPSLPHNERSSSWTYLNGLGSEMQTIMEAASPSGKDIVQPILYDENGMVTMQYLPYTINQPEPGNFRREAKQETLDFYANPPAAVATSLFPYAETVYGKSPQNNVIGQGAPGEAWQVGTGHSVTLVTATNSATDVLLWEYNAGTGALVANAYYPEAQLMKAITINEDGEKSAVYTDMLGRKLKQEVHLTDEDIIATYFVYNNRGSLLFEITPLVIDQVTSYESLPYTINQNIIQNLCYTYSYDERERLVETRWADKEVIYYVYDRWDRLVLSQDGNQRQKNEWSFTKYDRYNRGVLSGLYETSVPYDRIEMQAEIDSYYAQPAVSRFETFGGSIHGYTNLSFPAVGNEKAYLTITYYDDYAFMDEVNGFGAAYAFDATTLDCETVPQGTYCFPSMESLNTVGKITGSKTKVIGRDQWLNAVMYYDERGRSIQSVTGNYVGSVDRQSSLYNFSGWLLATHLSHHGADDMSRGIKRRYVYDHTGRLLEGYHELFDNGVSQGEVFLAENKYNELGQLIEKNLHIEHGAPIQSIDYRYNIRGWLQSINGADPEAGQGINDNDTRQDLFGMELIYNGILNGVQNNE